MTSATGMNRNTTRPISLILERMLFDDLPCIIQYNESMIGEDGHDGVKTIGICQTCLKHAYPITQRLYPELFVFLSLDIKGVDIALIGPNENFIRWPITDIAEAFCPDVSFRFYRLRPVILNFFL